MSAEHEHAAFEVSSHPADAWGRPIDRELLGRFIGTGSGGSRAFRCVVHAGLDGAHAAMLRECDRMTPSQRRAAAATAADLLIGELT